MKANEEHHLAGNYLFESQEKVAVRNLIVLLVVILTYFCQAQKQGDIWHFGRQCGLNFNNGSPFAISGGQTGTDISPSADPQEGTSCISDSSGSLLFYTGGKTIWNRLHQPMPNGSGIIGGTSSTQAALILPKPANDSLFYVFTSDEFQNFYPLLVSKGYRYSVVNMCLDGGKGDVVNSQKNILLMDTSTEKIAACSDAQGTGYWIVGHKMFSNEFKAWHLTAGGITATVSSIIGTIHGWNYTNSSWNQAAAQSQMKISSQGNKLALAIGNFDPGYVDIFDFNSSTGQVSNPCHMVIDSALHKRTWGIEFSPDGSKLYVTGNGGIGGRKLYQFDLLAGSCASIKTSQVVIFQSLYGHLYSLQLGPDKKIYAVTKNNGVGQINFPNLPGASCNFDSLSVVFTGTNTYCLPAFVSAYTYSNNLVDCCPDIQLTSSSTASVLCAGDQVTLTVNGAGTYSWNTGSNTNSITVSPTITTTYTVIGSNSPSFNCSEVITITQNVTACLNVEKWGDEKFEVRLFPNPSKLGINISSSVQIEEITVSNQWGQIIYKTEPNVTILLLNLETPGIYFITLSSEGFKKTKKVVVTN